ncbi:glycosyltransferase family 2 protein [Candidatus Peribacteria bacterium]|nr:glycosyltransferase family 2 protein [Candidatus Peribacteria bacterium]MBT4021453.1 glycosyltransferase family 2 protein [Candidatus Peribacteria bacterium]MBT4240469.1 glycosyltransferase family 2 protein [Candidatus Peribacteria bacterium]MBT4474551.1 glycosyltransferase family 2 protein [Candidatus Peribacteria bacterium]
MNKTLVIIPTFNERENIGTLVDGIFAHKREDIDVLVVDDNSPDGTANIVRDLQKKYGEERLLLEVRMQGKAGRGSACMHGFSFALNNGYEAAIEMDSDLSHNPVLIPKFIEGLKDADIVIGSRYLPGGRVEGWPFHRKLLSKFADKYIRFILKIPISDYTNGYRCYGRKALEMLPELDIDGVGFTVIPQMSYQFHKRGCTFGEIPIVFINRRFGESNMSHKEIVESFFAVLKIRSHSLYTHTKQFVKFVLTGFTSAFWDLGILTFCIEYLGWGILPSNALAALVAITNAFVINKLWTFRNDDKKHLKQYVQFWMVYGSSFALNMGMMWIFAEIMGVWYILVKLFVIPTCAIWNYLWMHFGVFRKKDNEGNV